MNDSQIKGFVSKVKEIGQSGKIVGWSMTNESGVSTDVRMWKTGGSRDRPVANPIPNEGDYIWAMYETGEYQGKVQYTVKTWGEEQRPNIAPPSNSEERSSFGYVFDENGVSVRTMPTVREQFAMRWVEALASVETTNWTADDISLCLKRAGEGWDMFMGSDTPKPSTASPGAAEGQSRVIGGDWPESDIPPPAGEDDYHQDRDEVPF